MACPDCKASKETNGLWNTFNSPQCPYCTARLIQRIGKLRAPTSDQITVRRRSVLSDAVAWGHDEALIRKLAKGPLCLAP